MTHFLADSVSDKTPFMPSDDLLQYLRPFAQEGKVVGEADVRRFFEERMEAIRERRAAAQ